ncbi:hypothetical protein K438DRAFT_1958937 [Mycena galopus ATCC 62051]|nr:hypothetical protein K438DRAFT_1958937 [Mycena galopus ATCC 62051]
MRHSEALKSALPQLIITYTRLLVSQAFALSLKRKVVPEEDDIETQLAKKTTSTGFRPKPLQVSASRNYTPSFSASMANGNGNPKPTTVMPRPLTHPCPPCYRAPDVPGCECAARVHHTQALVGSMATAPDVITNLHKRLVTLESAHTQDKEWLTTLFESAAASSSAAAVSTTTTSTTDSEAILAAQSQLASTSAQLAATTTQLTSLQSELPFLRTTLCTHQDGEATARANTASLRNGILSLKAEVLSGSKTAVSAAHGKCDVIGGGAAGAVSLV